MPPACATAVEVLGLQAVHHGVRAAEDPDAIGAARRARHRAARLPDQQRARSASATCFDVHPARELFDRRRRVTVNTDDFTLFGASVCDEMLTLARMGFTAAEIAAIIETRRCGGNTSA